MAGEVGASEAELERLRFAIMRVTAEPDEPEGHLELGLILLNNGKIAAADEAFARVLEIEPGDADARYFRAVISQHWGESGRAVGELAKLMRHFPRADAPWAPLRAAIDGLLRRTHLYFALALIVSAVIALGNRGADGSDVGQRVAMALFVAVGLLIVGIRWRGSVRRIGRRTLHSLVLMRFHEDALIRTSIVLDGVAAVLTLAMVFAPHAFWSVLAPVVIVVLLVASVLHLFTTGKRA